MPYHIRPATMAAYRSLKQFHYIGGDPGVPTRVFAAYVGAFQTPVAVIVEAHPVLQAAARNLALPNRYSGPKDYAAHRLNAEMRTIARVIVAPAHRGHGLAARLVETILNHSVTPFVEAFSREPHQFFETAGMTALRTREALRLDTFYYLHSTRPLHEPMQE